ncbi:MAG: TonB-dependent receptor, partial [Fusobacteriaceae bacterium]
MKKKIAVCSFIISAVLYANDDGGIKLNESVISTGGFETTLEKTDKNINIITTKDIENQNFENITEALNGLPGITVFSNTFGSFVDLRGQGVSKAKSNVQILVDGVNINPLDPAHGVLPIDTIPIGNIERIEVIPGGGSIVYGDGAVGGVINIITKVESGVASNYLNSKVGSLEERKLELGTGHRFNDKVLVQLDYSGASTDGYRDGNDAEKHFVQGTVNYKINDSNKIILKYSRAEEDSKSPSMLTREQLNEDRRGSGEVNPWDSPSQSELTRDLIALNYKSNLSEKLSLNLDINYQNTENRWSSQMEVYQMPTFTSKAQESVGVFHDKKFVFSPKLKYEYANGEIIGGIDYKDMEAKRIGEPGYLGMYLDYDAIFSKKSLAAFILNRYSYRNWDFTQGYRRERSEYKTGRSLSLYTFGPPLEMGANPTVRSSSNFKNSREMENDAYELGFNYRYSDTGNIYTRGEFGFRTPAPSELIDKPQDKTLGYLENSLEAERFKNFEIGLKDAYKNMFFSLTLFHTLTEDEILQIGSMPTWWEFINM